jgi:hypothetical protein
MDFVLLEMEHLEEDDKEKVCVEDLRKNSCLFYSKTLKSPPSK